MSVEELLPCESEDNNMTTYNTSADAANTGVRAFLTRVGEFYLGRAFNTNSGKARDDWNRIKVNTFKG